MPHVCVNEYRYLKTKTYVEIAWAFLDTLLDKKPPTDLKGNNCELRSFVENWIHHLYGSPRQVTSIGPNGRELV